MQATQSQSLSMNHPSQDFFQETLEQRSSQTQLSTRMMPQQIYSFQPSLGTNSPPTTISTTTLGITSTMQSTGENVNGSIQQAVNMTTDAQNSEKERRLFMQDLTTFMMEIGKPFTKIPIMGYKELDLFCLFHEVVIYGGFNEVVKNVGTWSKIWKRLSNFDPSITDSSFRLKKNYERYLLDYEFKCFPEHRKQATEMDKQISKRDSSEKIKRTEKPSKAKKTQKKRKVHAALKEVPRNKTGEPKLPLVLSGGELTILSLGKIIPQIPYVTEKHIWPVGYKSIRVFASMVSSTQRVKYHCEIIDGGDKPQFKVIAEDDPTNVIISSSPSGAWREVLKKITEIKDISTPNSPSSCSSAPSSPAPSPPVDIQAELAPFKNSARVRGTLQFGLAHAVVVQLIRELPDAEKCFHIATSFSVEKKKRKRVSSDIELEEHSNREDYNTSPLPPLKLQKTEHYLESFFSFDIIESREEFDAVETLRSLKNSVVY